MRLTRVFLAGCGVAALSVATAVQAQSADNGAIASSTSADDDVPNSEIVVTGSYIRGSAEDAAAPVEKAVSF